MWHRNRNLSEMTSAFSRERDRRIKPDEIRFDILVDVLVEPKQISPAIRLFYQRTIQLKNPAPGFSWILSVVRFNFTLKLSSPSST
jgi:hypothetical protein